MRRKILSLDFDGVIHSYTSGWQGPRNIPDPPVKGAIEFIARAVEVFEVHIYSSRSNYFGGRWAMKQWLKRWCRWAAHRDDDPLNVEGMPYAEVEALLKNIVNRVHFSRHKPPASVGLDDRVMTFKGIFPTLEELDSFKPWNK